MQKILISDYLSTPVDIDTRMEIYKKCGLNEISPSWGTQFYNFNFDRFYFFDKCKSHKMKIEIVHLDYVKNNNLWADCLAGDIARDETIQHINECADRKIKMGVFHPTYPQFNTPIPPKSEIGLDRIRQILDVCGARGFTLLIENLVEHTHLDYILSNIKHPNLKMLIDVGHAHCFTHDEFELLEKYRSLIIASHVHNNYGTNDDHADLDKGDIDIKRFMSKSKFIKYIILEINPKDVHTPPDFETFLRHNLRLITSK